MKSKQLTYGNELTQFKVAIGERYGLVATSLDVSTGTVLTIAGIEPLCRRPSGTSVELAWLSERCRRSSA